MIKRILYITFILSLIGACVYFYLQVNSHSEQEESCNLTEVIPNNAGIIIEVPDIYKISKHEKSHSEMWASLGQIGLINEYINTWKTLDTLAHSHQDLMSWSKVPAIISYHLIGKSPIPFYAFKLNNKASEKAWKTILVKNGLIPDNKYNGIQIYSLKSIDGKAYFVFHGGYFITSRSTILLEQSIRHLQGQYEVDASFEKLSKTKGSTSDMNIFVNYDRFELLLKCITNSKSTYHKRLNALGEWGEYDFIIEESDVILNGFSSYDSNDYWHMFSRQESEKHSMHKIIPSHSKGFMTFSLSDLAMFRSDYVHYVSHIGLTNDYHSWLSETKQAGIETIDIVFDDIIENEIALSFDNNLTTLTDESTVFIKTKSAIMAKEAMEKLLKSYSKKTGIEFSSQKSQLMVDEDLYYDYYTFPFPSVFKYLYGEAFADVSAKYFCIYDNYLIFADNKKTLAHSIMANILKQTMSNDESFNNIYNGFSEKNSIFFFERTDNVLDQLSQYTSPSFCKEKGLDVESLNNIYAIAYQMTSTNKYVYNSIFLHHNANLKDKPLTVWNSQLDAKAVGKPTFVKNHYTNENEICIQDEAHNLYLLSASGRVIWKKPIGEAIISDIKQIDFYKNNKLQLLFNTASKIVLLDREGNFVDRYPILLPNKASAGLSLFDYSNNRDYRIFVPTMDKHLYLYTKNGNLNKDFSFRNSESPLTTSIQHFVVKNKDYICFSDENRVYILDRRGNERVKLKQQFKPSINNRFYLHKGSKPYLATTNNVGDIVKIFFDGTTTTVDLPESRSTHYFAMKSLINKNEDNYIIVDQMKLNVYDEKGGLLYNQTIKDGQLSAPYFYQFSSSEIKVGLVDHNKNKIYLFNGENGDIYKDFPLEGSTPFSIGFLESSDWRFNLLVGSERSSLYNYKVK